MLGKTVEVQVIYWCIAYEFEVFIMMSSFVFKKDISFDCLNFFKNLLQLLLSSTNEHTFVLLHCIVYTNKVVHSVEHATNWSKMYRL